MKGDLRQMCKVNFYFVFSFESYFCPVCLWASGCLTPLLSNASESLCVSEMGGIHLFCIV